MTKEEFNQLFVSVVDAVIHHNSPKIIELLKDVPAKVQRELFLSRCNLFAGTLPFFAILYPEAIPALFANFPDELLNEVLSAKEDGNTVFTEIISWDSRDAFEAIISGKPREVVSKLLLQTDYEGRTALELIGGDCEKALGDYYESLDFPIKTETSTSPKTSSSNLQNISTPSYADSFYHAASQSSTITVLSRLSEKSYNFFRVPSALQYCINMATTLSIATRMIYEPVRLLVSSATYTVVHHAMSRLNFTPRSIRQTASILTISNLAALELYNSSLSENTIENSAYLLSTLGGATMGVIGTDLLLDGTEKFIGYCYEKCVASNHKHSNSDSSSNPDLSANSTSPTARKHL